MDLAFVTVVGCCLIVALWLRIVALETQINKERSYFEWWLRSMEERKEDRPVPESDESDVIDEYYED